MGNPVIELTNVSCQFGSNQVLDDVSLDVAAGEVLGIIGPNGCGKTTLLKIIMGFIYPNKGTVIVGGKKIEAGVVGELPIGVGALIEAPNFLPYLSGYKNLEILALIRNEIGQREIEEVMKYVGLDPKNTKKVRKYSLGMKQRLGIAQAIMENQSILLFDEPTNALDTEGLKIFTDIIETAKEKGKSIVLISHRKEEIDLLCDRVVLLEKGKLMPIKDRVNVGIHNKRTV